MDMKDSKLPVALKEGGGEVVTVTVRAPEGHLLVEAQPLSLMIG